MAEPGPAALPTDSLPPAHSTPPQETCLFCHLCVELSCLFAYVVTQDSTLWQRQCSHFFSCQSRSSSFCTKFMYRAIALDSDISHLLFLRPMQCSHGGVLSPPAPFSPRIALPPGMLLSTISVTQHLYTFRKKCFLLQESFLEMSAFGEAAQAACVDPVGSIRSRPHSPVLLVSTSVRLLPLLHPRPAGPGTVGEGVGVASRHVGLNCIPSLLALCSWESLLDFPSLCVLIN